MFRRSLSRGADIARARLYSLGTGWVPTQHDINRAFSPAADVESASPGPNEPPGPAEFAEVRLQHSGVRALLVLVAAGLVVAGMFLVLNWPRGSLAPEAAVPPVLTGATTLGSAPSQVSSSPSGQVVVDVAGEVRHPGVCELQVGSRVIDALHAAGGLTHRGDTTSLNLARVLTDGEQVLVPRSVPLGGSGAAPTVSTSSGAGAMVSINTATLEQLDELPGIGPVLAQAIIDYRTQNGPFTSISQLTDVSGIGDATYSDLEPYVSL